MAQTQAQYINVNLKRLANYIKGATNEPTELEIITWINNDANEFIQITPFLIRISR